MFNKQKLLNIVVLLAMVASLFFGGGSQVKAQTPTTPSSPDNISGNPLPQKPMTNAERAAAAQRASKARAATAAMLGPNAVNLLSTPGGAPDYFGIFPNWANSPFPASVSNLGDGTGALMTVTVTAGAVTGVTVVSGGSDYTALATNPTTVTVVGGGGTGATLGPIVFDANGGIVSVGVSAGGSGYNVPTTYNATTGASIPGTTGIRKFIDTLPGLGPTAANDLGNYISVGVPDQTIYSGSDYYEIAVVQYKQQFSADLPPSALRGYVQIWSAKWATDTGNPTTPNPLNQLFYPDGVTPIRDAANNLVYGVAKPSYLGPTLVAQANTPVRVKFTNYLPTGSGGNLFIPVDTSDMGAGTGPNGGAELYTQNRATLHLHGGLTPWISDGTPHQWITPAGESTSYPKGVSVVNVPDMPDPGVGSETFFYTNQQSARLMFYHDHAYGITRLNVYAGEAAGYLLQDTVEKQLQTAGILPLDTAQIPLIIQDKSFVPTAPQLLAEDPTWDSGKYGGYGNLWFPHVYMTNQNPADASGANPMGRWDYALWFWPPVDCNSLPAGHCLTTNIFAVNGGAEPAQVPAIPQPSLTPEGFMDTPTVNGVAYPVLTVDPKPYRFRILNAANDRMMNLQLYNAASNQQMWNVDANGKPTTLNDGNAGEVPMVPAVATPGFPATWPTDGRAGGVPDPAASGPNFVQIGTEGGFLPAPVVIPNQPVGYNYNRRDIVVLNVQDRALFLAPAERADVVVDFSLYAGKTLILYNDAPTPVPAFDTRTDYYTGDPDQTATGGAPTTLPGYGPNIRTIMQIKVNSTSPATVPATGVAVSSVTVGNQGAGYIQPAIDFVGGGGTGAAATVTGAVDHVTVNVPGAAGTYATAPAVVIGGGVAPTGGVAATAVAVISGGKLTGISVTNPGSGYAIAPAVTVNGAAGIATATLKITAITVAAGAGGTGYTTAPQVIISDLVPNAGFNATAIANLPAGLTPFNVANLQAAFLHGQTIVPALAGKGVFEADQDPIIYPVATYNSAYGLTLPADPYYRIQDLSKTFMPLNGINPIANNVENKTIQELFELNYGRMNATLGTEIPTTNFTNQTTIPLGYTDPATETLTDSITPLSPPAVGDGTQIWKITHNGVDSHVIHFHLFNVQLINRVGWDGAIRPPDANELGWKESVRMNPLEDAIVALRPTSPKLPFNVPDSIRALDPTQPIGATWPSIDPLTGNPNVITNAKVNFHWEYVWHCHILGHEENDMMRPIAFLVNSVVPAAPNPFSLLVVQGAGGAPNVALTWTDPTPVSSPTTLGNPANEIGFRIDRAIGTTGAFNALFTAPANSTTYTDTTVGSGVTYRYRVVAFNAAGQTASTTQSTGVITGAFPTPPTGLAAQILATTTGATQVYLTWTANATNTTGYRISRIGGTGAFTPVNINGRTTIQYFDTTVVAGTTYTYSLQAVNGTLASAPATLSILVFAVPAAPTNLASPSQTQTSITLTWTNNTLPAAVNIYFSLNGSTWSQVFVNNTATYTMTGLTNHTTRPSPYYFRIRAYVLVGSLIGYSNFTPTITVNTLP